MNDDGSSDGETDNKGSVDEAVAEIVAARDGVTAQPARTLDGSAWPPVLGDILRFQAALRPEAPALTFEGRTTSYGELAARARRVSQALAAAGLGHGDRIAYVGRNADRWFELFLGAAMTGVVMVPVNWRLAPPEIRHVLIDSTARLAFVDEVFAEAVASAPVRALAMDDYAAWRDAADDREVHVVVEPDDIALQIYTSGTTGAAKGALLSHHALNAVRVSQPQRCAWSRWSADDACLVSMPLFHIGGASMALSALYHGARIVVAGEFSADILFELVERERITKAFLAPTALKMAIEHPRALTADLSSLRQLSYGSSPIASEVLCRAIAIFDCAFAQVYGLTETSGTIVVLPPEDHDPARPERLRATGKPLAGVELAILDAVGDPLPPGVVGEVAVRSAAVMAGYWRRTLATREAIDANGWLRTGDAGSVDVDGYLHLRDRVKDMIISGGENVYPAEVEAVFAGHPAIAEVAVIGIPDERWGEAVKAVVVLRPGFSLPLDEARRWGRERIASYKLPASIEHIAALPRNASGKVLRGALRDVSASPFDEQGAS